MRACPTDSGPEPRRAGREFAAARPRSLPGGPLFFGHFDSQFGEKLAPAGRCGSKAGAAGSPDTPASAGVVSGTAPALEARPSQHRSKERGESWSRSAAPRPTAEVPRCAGRAVEAELGRVHVLWILDPVGEPATPVETARAAAGHADHGVRQALRGLGLLGVVAGHPLRVRPAPTAGSGLSAELLPTVRLVRVSGLDRALSDPRPGEKASDRPVVKLWLS